MKARMTSGAVALVASLALAPAALAGDYYVDGDVAATTDLFCPITAPCKTIAEGVNIAAGDDASVDTVHVGLGSAYPESVTVPDTPLTLLGGEYNFTGTGTQSVIDGGTAPAITLSFGSLARTISGLTLQGGDAGLNDDHTLGGAALENVTIEDNIFNETGSLNSFINLSGSPTITGNTIVGFDHAGEWGHGIAMNNAVAPRIVGNSVKDVERGIAIFGTTQQVTIAGNTIEPRGDDAPLGGGPGSSGIGLGVGAGGDVTGNLIRAGAVLNAEASGIYLSSDGFGSRRLARNRIFGFPGRGVWVQTTDPVTLNGDVIAGNGGAGVYLQPPGSNVVATNATVWNNDASPGLNGEFLISETATLAIDSTIVGDDGVRATVGTPSCTATFSRGPAVSPRCQGQFATNATPSFVNAAGNDFHLTPTGNAALIDMGNPAPASSPDIDGEPRAIDALANQVCAPRRDIGADEVSLANADCPPPVLPTTPPAAARTCPKGKKLKTVKKKGKKKKKCVKKKRKKRKR